MTVLCTRLEWQTHRTAARFSCNCSAHELHVTVLWCQSAQARHKGSSLARLRNCCDAHLKPGAQCIVVRTQKLLYVVHASELLQEIPVACGVWHRHASIVQASSSALSRAHC